MCGIAGIVPRDPGAHVDRWRLERMRDELRHRGPDGSGLLIEPGIGLVHTRLAIVDVAGGDQPMTSESGEVSVVFNGEIYNHADLRAELETRGHRYRTRCDTEALIHLYDQDADGFVSRLRGMFAFALWDRARARLVLARDRLGIKPLYYAWTERELIFASEMKALFASGRVNAAFNDDVLPEFLATRFVTGEATFFRGVRKLLPGHVLTWGRGETSHPRRYWRLPRPAASGAVTAAVAARALRERLEAAVASHLMSDVPVGVFLSGGIDSSVLAALAAKATREPLQTFAVGFDDPATSELPYARLVAEHIGARHREVTVSASDFFAHVPTAVWHEDEPVAFASSVPLYLLARAAQPHVKVALTGEGADELLLGYNRYRVTQWNARLGRLYWAAVPRSVRSAIRSGASRLPARLGRIATRSFVGLDPDIESLYHDNFAVFPRHHVRTLLCDGEDRGRCDPYRAAVGYFDEAPGDLLERVCQADLQSYLHELLMKQDQMSMAASIESRVPFLDDRLVEYLAAVPARVKLPGWQTKRLLRRAAGELVPPEILARTKMGFPVPLDRWLRGPFAGVIDEFVASGRVAARRIFRHDQLRRLVQEHRAGVRSHADALWLLVTFEMWVRMFLEGERPDEVMKPVAVRRPDGSPLLLSTLPSCTFSG